MSIHSNRTFSYIKQIKFYTSGKFQIFYYNSDDNRYHIDVENNIFKKSFTSFSITVDHWAYKYINNLEVIIIKIFNF